MNKSPAVLFLRDYMIVGWGKSTGEWFEPNGNLAWELAEACSYALECARGNPDGVLSDDQYSEYQAVGITSSEEELVNFQYMLIPEMGLIVSKKVFTLAIHGTLSSGTLSDQIKRSNAFQLTAELYDEVVNHPTNASKFLPLLNQLNN